LCYQWLDMCKFSFSYTVTETRGLAAIVRGVLSLIGWVQKTSTFFLTDECFAPGQIPLCVDCFFDENEMKFLEILAVALVYMLCVSWSWPNIGNT
jgi:hypothetical protein